ncbi:hypothetical protein JavanS99_0009 [Streptococcus satellite phage Javan99]|nr:hypothetical protein JavanS99_0009 [Streptococcus satellite phage Javan99]
MLNVLFGDGKHRGLGRVLLVVFKSVRLPRLIYLVKVSMALFLKGAISPPMKSVYFCLGL